LTRSIDFDGTSRVRNVDQILFVFRLVAAPQRVSPRQLARKQDFKEVADDRGGNPEIRELNSQGTCTNSSLPQRTPRSECGFEQDSRLQGMVIDQLLRNGEPGGLGLSRIGNSKW